MRLLLVEHDDVLSAGLAEALGREGFRVDALGAAGPAAGTVPRPQTWSAAGTSLPPGVPNATA